MQTTRLTRREVLGFFAAALAASQLPAFAQTAKGYGSDPDLTKLYKPGDVWPLTFSAAEKNAATALADVIFPTDDLGPAASTLRIADFVDEWISAPYPQQQSDRPIIIDGLAWLDAEAQRRFQKDFAALTAEQHRALCDDICWPPDAKPEFAKPAAFFVQFRALCAGAYYGTQEGWKAIGFIGNVPLPKFDGPPAEVLAQLGLEQTVK